MRLNLCVRGRKSIRGLRRSIDKRRREGSRVVRKSSEDLTQLLQRVALLPIELRVKIFTDYILLQSIRDICSPANSKRVFLASLVVSQSPTHRPGQSLEDLLSFIVMRNKVQLLRCALENSHDVDASAVLRITHRIEIAVDRYNLTVFPSECLLLWYEFIIDQFDSFSQAKTRRGILFDLAAHVLGALVSYDLASVLRPILRKAVHCDSLMNSIMEHNPLGSSWLEIVLQLVGCRWSIEAMTALLSEVLALHTPRLKQLMGETTFQFLQNADIDGIIEMLLHTL